MSFNKKYNNSIFLLEDNGEDFLFYIDSEFICIVNFQNLIDSNFYKFKQDIPDFIVDLYQIELELFYKDLEEYYKSYQW